VHLLNPEGDLVRMLKISKDGKKKQENFQLQILLSEMGFFTDLKRKKIRFNPKPNKEKEPEMPTFIDLHLEIASKIDEVIKKHELQPTSKEEPTEETTLTEIRKPWNRTLIRPLFKTETLQNNFEINDTLFEVEKQPVFNQNIHINNLTPLSNKVTTFNEPLNLESIDFVKKNDEPQNILTSLGRIKINKNPTKTKNTKQKTNGVTIAKTDLEKTKQELERKKHELEEMQRLAKEKEEELKKKEHEKNKQEKLRKEKQKEIEKEKKLAEKLEKKHEFELEKEKIKREKQHLLEQKRQEKIRQIEEKKQIQEQELKKKQKEKEEIQKQKLLKKQEKIKEIEEQDQFKEKIKKPSIKKEIKFDLLAFKKKKTKTKPEIKTQKPEKIIASEKKQKIQEKTTIDLLDEEVGQALEIIDTLLEKLPAETIDEFVQSNDFEIYERVVSKYKKK